MENATERDAIAMSILGRSAQDLVPLITAGSDAMKNLAAEAHSMGAVLSEDTLGKLGAFDDGIQRMNNAMTSLKNNVGAVLAPALAELSEEAAAKMGAFAKSIQDAEGDVGKIGEIVGETPLDLTMKSSINYLK